MVDLKIYQEELMHHYRYPKNRKIIESADVSTVIHNPSCGDSVSFQLKIENGVIVDIGFQGSGCVISQATASMLSQKVLNTSLTNVIGLKTEDILSLIKISLGPTRLRCALLSLEAVQEAVKNYAQ